MCLIKQKGNAIAEFLVVAAVLIPAVLSLPLLGKLADVNHVTTQASRYAVWEKTVGGKTQKNDEQLAAEVTNRFMSKSDEKIVTVLSSEHKANNFWSDISGEKSLIKPESLLSVRSQNKDIPGDVGAEYIAKAMVVLGDTLDGVISNAKWDVEDKGFYLVSVDAELSSNRLSKDAKNCSGVVSEESGGCLSVVGAIFVDEWDAGSSKQVESRVRSMVPAGAAESLVDAISIIGVVPLFQELKYLKGVFGQVQPDILPPDRYGDK
jgi:hypothetical protein